MKLAVAVDNLSLSQLAWGLVTSGNELVRRGPQNDVVALYMNPSRPCVSPIFSTMHMANGWGFDGVVISTSLDTALTVAGFPSVSRKVFYAWDLEWMRLQHKRYGDLRAIYADPRHTVVARCEDHARVLRSCWNIPVEHVVEDCNLVDFARILSGDKSGS